MESFANALSPLIGRVIVDRTDVSGLIDLQLEWTPAPDQFPPQTADGHEPPRFDPNGPSVFTALQEQLGLKLESTRGPVDVIVIDRAERPSEN